MNGRLATAEAWRSFVSRVLCLIAGLVILMWQLFTGDRFVPLMLIGAGLCGPYAAGSIATVFSAWKNGGPK